MITPVPEILLIGGSAGALEPLLEILATLPDELTLPIAVVLHVTPRQPSLMPGLMARVTRRTIREAEDKDAIVPSTVYVAPPNYHMLIERQRTIALSVDDLVNYSRPSIDVLFDSAAVAYGERACALVLSGANSDGAEGLARIAAAGGTALVQAPSSAAHTTMPAAAARLVPSAHSLAPQEVASFLTGFARTPLHAARLS